MGPAGMRSRLSFSTAARVAATRFPASVPVVYVATGEGFADALAGVPAAALHDAPLLLVGRDTLPAASREQLTALRPGRIVVLGGQSAVSAAVAADLAAITAP